MKSKKASPKKTKISTSVKPAQDFVTIIEERFQHHVGVLMEDTNSKFQQIQEGFATLATNEALQRVENEVKDIKSKQKIIEQVVKGHSAILNEHSAILKEHSAILKEHSVKLDQKADKKDLEQLATKEDIREIKTILTNHQQRLATLENR